MSIPGVVCTRCGNKFSASWGDVSSICYTCQLKQRRSLNLSDRLLEGLASLMHDEWMEWAARLMAKEELSKDRVDRWSKCMIPYAELSEEMKEYDRKWARKAIALLERNNVS